jgi:YbdK family carboxylate-amine ligase
MSRQPDWARWPGADEASWTLGVEEEVMLLHPEDWSLAQKIDDVLAELDETERRHMSSETHSAAIELQTGIHGSVQTAVAEVRHLRRRLTEKLDGLGLRAGCSGTHPFANWHDMKVAGADRHQAVHGSMRALARREPTFALHVHVGVPTPAGALAALNQMRAHLPLLLALSANSPYWQGRDTGLASTRTPLFQAFPRVGIPRVFSSYADWARSVDLLIASEALEDHTYLWWDVRLQPKWGTVEVRIMDAQVSCDQTAALHPGAGRRDRRRRRRGVHAPRDRARLRGRARVGRAARPAALGGASARAGRGGRRPVPPRRRAGRRVLARPLGGRVALAHRCSRGRLGAVSARAGADAPPPSARRGSRGRSAGAAARRAGAAWRRPTA